MPQVDLSPQGLRAAITAADEDVTSAQADATTALAAIVSVLSGSIKDEDITADGVAKTIAVGTIPAGAFILGIEFLVAEQFVIAGGVTIAATDLTVGGVSVIPSDDFDVKAATGTAASAATMRFLDGAVSFTITGSANINPATAGEIDVNIVYVVPNA